MTRTADHSDQRRVDLAAIHVLAAQLGVDTRDKNPSSEYRSMLWTVGGPTAGEERSAANLDAAGRMRVRAHLASLLRAREIKPRPATGSQRNSEWAWVNRAAKDRQPMLRKIIMQLKAAGRGRAYADGICERMKLSRLEFCGSKELRAIVAALSYDARRRSVRE